MHFVRFDQDADVAGELRGLTGGRGVDVVYDAVGGVTTPAALDSLAHRGRLVVINAVGNRTAQIDLIDLYHNETQILGSDSRKLKSWSQPPARAIEPVASKRGLPAAPITASTRWPRAPAAYQAVASPPAGRHRPCVIDP